MNSTKRGLFVSRAVLAAVLVIQSTCSSLVAALYYGTDFSSLPIGSVVSGSARVEDGVLKLTDAVNSQAGAFITPSSVQPMTEFTMQALIRISGSTCCTAGRNELKPADGMSFNFAADIPDNPGYYAYEEGIGSGLRLSIDTWDSGDPDTAPAIELIYNGVVKAVAPMDGWRDNNIPDAGRLPIDPQNGAPLTLDTDARDQTMVQILSGPHAWDIYQCHQGDSSKDLAIYPNGALSGPTVYVGLANDLASVPAPPGPGYIALVQRGTSSFDIKAANVFSAGYSGMVLFNHAAGGEDYLVMGMGSSDKIPAVMVGHSAGLAIAGVGSAAALIVGQPGADVVLRRISPSVAPWGQIRWVLRSDGTSDVWWKGVKVIDDIQTGYQPLVGRVGIGARTGGANEAHWIDDLNIEYEVLTPPNPSDCIHVLAEDFSTSNGGFTVVNSQSPAPEEPWVYDAATGQWRVNGSDWLGTPSYSALISPSLTLTKAGAVWLSFDHRYSFEYDGLVRWDGGQVRFSVNGAPFIPAVPDYFTANGYPLDPITGDGVLKYQRAFNGDSAGYALNEFITSTVFLGRFAKNDTVAVQLIAAWDQYAMGITPNWAMDTCRICLFQDRLSLNLIPGLGGQVAVSVPPGADGLYPRGSHVTLTAQPAAGYEFSGWSGDVTGVVNPTTIVMDSDKSVAAHFIPARCALTLVVVPSGAGDIIGNVPPEADGKYPPGTVITLTANPARGYDFSYWSGDVSGTANPLTLILNGSLNLIANYVPGQSSTDVLPTDSFSIEAEQFDFNRGQYHGFVSGPFPQNHYSGLEYQGFSAVAEVDYHRGDNLASPDLFRIGEQPNVPIEPNQDPGTPDLKRPGFNVMANHQIGPVNNGDWYHYTRNVPAGLYTAWGAFSHSDAGAEIGGWLGIVTNGQGTTNPRLKAVGNFSGVAPGGWGNNALVPLLGPLGQPAVFQVSQMPTTLRLTTRRGNYDWFTLVPVATAPPQVTAIDPPDGAQMRRDWGDITFTIEDLTTAVVPSSVQIYLDGVSQASGLLVNKRGPTTTAFCNRRGALFDLNSWHLYTLVFKDTSVPPRSYTNESWLCASIDLPPTMTLGITVNPPGSGTVEVNPPPTDGKYSSNTVVILTARPSAGFAFLGWSGATNSSSNPVSLTMDSSKIVTAGFGPIGTLQFQQASWTVTESGGVATITVTRAGGSAGAAGVTYATSDGTAVAGPDYTADVGTLQWASGDMAAKTFRIAIQDNGLMEPAETVNLSLSNPTGGASLAPPSTAVLTIVDDDQAVPTYTLTLSASPSAGGTVQASPLPGDDGKYASNTVVKLTAKPNPGYVFVGWGGSVSGASNPAIVTIDANRVATALFETEAANVRLVATVRNGVLTLSWDPSAAGYTLESTGSLGPPAQWIAVPGVVNNQVILTIQGATQFYRLRR